MSTMANVDYRIQFIATNIAQLIQEWPDITWQDVQGINRHIGFSHRTCSEGMMDAPGVGTGGSRLRKADLQAAWEMAQTLAREGRI